MDDFILRSYRSVTDDLLLLYDAYMISKNGRRGARSASDYLDVVKMLIHEEAVDESRLLQHINQQVGGRLAGGTGTLTQDWLEDEPSSSSLSVSYSLHSPGLGQDVDIYDSPSLNALFKMTWDFFRTVVLQFIVEEASQYLFWSSKAVVVLNDDILHSCSESLFSVTMFHAWAAVLKSRWIQDFYGGLLPYLCAKSFNQMEYIMMQMKRYTYASLAGSSQLSIGTFRKKKKQFSANTLIMSRSLSANENNSEFAASDECAMDSHHKETNNSKVEESRDGSVDGVHTSRESGTNNDGMSLPGKLFVPNMMTPGMVLYRCLRYTLAHPFYVVVLLMIKNHSFNNHATHSPSMGGNKQNWISTVLEIAAKRGSIYILFRGLRSVIAASLIPYDFSFLGFGVVETLLYRRMTRPIVEDELSDIKERSLDANIDIYTSTRVLTTGTRGLLMEAQGMTMRHGVSSMLVYSAMSCFLYLPGLCNFMAARSLLFLVTGPSATRRRQLKRRKELVQKMLKSS